MGQEERRKGGELLVCPDRQQVKRVLQSLVNLRNEDHWKEAVQMQLCSMVERQKERTVKDLEH